MNKKYLSWDIITECAEKIVKEINERKFEPEVLVPILRGGLGPCAILSHLLNVREIYPIRCSRYTGVFKATKPKVEPFPYNINGKDILVIDDILDTGETYEAVSLALKKNKPNRIVCATMFVREDSSRPSFWGKEAPKDEWLVFPWEKREYSGD